MWCESKARSWKFKIEQSFKVIQMRNVKTENLECQNVEHRCENCCGKISKNSEKRAIESEVEKLAKFPFPWWDG